MSWERIKEVAALPFMALLVVVAIVIISFAMGEEHDTS